MKYSLPPSLTACLVTAIALQFCLTPVSSADPVSTGVQDFYLSSTGKDDNPGTKEKPLATLAQARNVVREWNRSNRKRNITVWISGGEYQLSEPVVFGPDDGAKPGQIILYAALPGEVPVFSGGRRLDGWKVSGGRWTVTLPEVAKGEWDFAQLFVDGQRRSRPRLPRDGYYYIAGSAPSSPQCQSGLNNRFRFGGKALLVRDSKPGAKDWVLLTPLQPAEPLTPQQAGAVRLGQTVNVDGVVAKVSNLFQSTFHQAESPEADAFKNGDVLYCFSGPAGPDTLLVRWNATYINFFRGHALPEKEVTAAFKPVAR